MTVTRRGFFSAILSSAAAPAIVRAESLMPIYVPKLALPMSINGIIVPGDFTVEAWLYPVAGGSVHAAIIRAGRYFEHYINSELVSSNHPGIRELKNFAFDNFCDGVGLQGISDYRVTNGVARKC